MDDEETRITESETTKTIATTIHPQFGSDDFQLLLTIPKQNPQTSNNHKIPITAHISKTGPDTALGCYVYSIIDLRNSTEKQAKIYQTLLNNSEETLLDLTKKLGYLVTKKYQVPSYVSISGDIIIEEFIGYAKEVTALINKSFES